MGLGDSYVAFRTLTQRPLLPRAVSSTASAGAAGRGCLLEGAPSRAESKNPKQDRHFRASHAMINAGDVKSRGWAARVLVDGVELRLARNEYELLAFLAEEARAGEPADR